MNNLRDEQLRNMELAADGHVAAHAWRSPRYNGALMNVVYLDLGQLPIDGPEIPEPLASETEVEYAGMLSGPEAGDMLEAYRDAHASDEQQTFAA